MTGRSGDPPTEQPGRIVAAYGGRVLVETPTGDRFPCRLFGRRLQVICGDAVRWSMAEAEGAEGLILEVEPRRSELARISATGTREPIVANLDLLVAVLAPVPAPDYALCDRYLAAAEWAGLAAAVTLNKTDLPGADDPTLAAELANYRALGYPVARSSKRTAGGAAELEALFKGHVSILVGQSGVGKSSLINLLVPGGNAAVQEVSRATDAGRHTTTASTLFHLPGGGELIDSPGVRDFAPSLPAPRDVACGFREIMREAAGCRFQDCRHTGEPGCAVHAAVGERRISARRLASYRQLRRLAEELEQRQRRSGKARAPEGSARKPRK